MDMYNGIVCKQWVLYHDLSNIVVDKYIYHIKKKGEVGG